MIQAASYYSDATGLRITLINKDGKVLGESGLSANEVSLMDNHLDRPEIQQSNNKKFGIATRYSSTLKKDYIYVALKIDLEPITYIRVSQTMDFANTLIAHRQAYQYRIIFLISLILIAFTFLLDRWVTSPIRKISKVAQKIKSGDWSSRSEVKGSDEIADLAISVNEMAETLGTDISKIISMSEVRSEFLINVTHELKTPIASISGYLETLLDGALEIKR
jgi:Signal transduction histidine kinase